MGKKVVAVVGSYRRGGTTDTVVQAVLEGAREGGAETETIYLAETSMEFCTNCRRCTQQLGSRRGECSQKDGLQPMLRRLEEADGVVLGSPVNCANVTAVWRRWMERLVGCAYWPWGSPMPRMRNPVALRPAVLVVSAAMPGFLIPWATGAPRALRDTARMLGSRTAGKLWVGLAAASPETQVPERVLERARRMGRKLA